MTLSNFLPMFFFSHLLGAEIMDSADSVVGKVVDLISSQNGDKFPTVMAMVYKESGSKEIKALKWDYVENVGKKEIALNTLKEKIEPYESRPSEHWLARDILDKQIVDLQGARVVRVNDLRFGTIGGELKVLGIDVSTKGLLRRLGVDRLPIFSFIKPSFIDWEKVQLVGKSLKLSTVSQELVKLHPADLANIVEDLTPHQSHKLMQTLDERTAAKVFEELEPEAKQHLMKTLDEEKLMGVLTHVPMDELVDYLKTLHLKDRRKIMASIGDKRKKTIQQFLHYEDDTAGGLMTTDFVKATPNMTVAETREQIREVSESLRSINFVYVTNENDQLLGIVSLRSLIVYPPAQKLRQIMKKIRSHQTVNVNSNIELIAKIMTRYNLHTVAVLDDNQKILGLVTVDDILRRLIPKA